VAVIGAGTAGLKAYKAAEAHGDTVLLIERGEGGSTCTRVGCMPSKLLLAAGRMAFDARRAGEFGIDTGVVRVDGAKVLARMRHERDRFVGSVLDEYHAIPDSERLQGEARFTGPTTLAVGDTMVEARAIVIATGGHPIVPDTLEPVKWLVHTHETIFSIEQLPASMAVLGAGPLGIELAQAFARLGVAVTVLDEGDTVGGLGDPVANEAARAALSREFDLRLGAKVTAAPAEDGRATLSWSGKSEGEVTVELVLAATGRPPNLESLDLDKTGLALDEHGTPLFEETTRRCGDSQIFIAGDANAWRPVLHEAARGGRIAGGVAAGGPPSRPLPAFAVTFTEPGIAVVGTAFDELPEGATIGCATVKDNGRADIEGEDQGVVRLYGDKAGRLIGAAIVAPGAEHLGHLVALGIDRGIDVATFADQPWYHPTLEEMLQSAARDLAGISD
jgi:dihydrolipoamide dehydrogenase